MFSRGLEPEGWRSCDSHAPLMQRSCDSSPHAHTNIYEMRYAHNKKFSCLLHAFPDVVSSRPISLSLSLSLSLCLCVTLDAGPLLRVKKRTVQRLGDPSTPMMVEIGGSLKHTLSIPMVMPRLIRGWPEERLREGQGQGEGEGEGEGRREVV